MEKSFSIRSMVNSHYNSIFSSVFTADTGGASFTNRVKLNPNLVQVRDEWFTHCGLVTSYGDRDLGQHWLR